VAVVACGKRGVFGTLSTASMASGARASGESSAGYRGIRARCVGLERPLEIHGATVPNARVPALAIVEHFDVFEERYNHNLWTSC